MASIGKMYLFYFYISIFFEVMLKKEQVIQNYIYEIYNHQVNQPNSRVIDSGKENPNILSPALPPSSTGKIK